MKAHDQCIEKAGVGHTQPDDTSRLTGVHSSCQNHVVQIAARVAGEDVQVIANTNVLESRCATENLGGFGNDRTFRVPL